eukprot:COSAG02_NODE_1223_length_13799_cov_11.479270_8_plen_176_part_00
MTTDGRTNDVTWLPHDTSDGIWELVNHIADVVGLPLTYAEPLQVVHYRRGQQYRQHWDAYDAHSERGKQLIGAHGNRLVTALGYINSVESSNPAEGGTSLPNLNITVSAVAGRLLVFHTTYPGTATKHADALHAGTPVTSGEKWAFNLWFHDRPHSASVSASQRRQRTKGDAKEL